MESLNDNNTPFSTSNILNPNALVNLKLAEISLKRELRRSDLYTPSDFRKELPSDLESRRRFILDHLRTNDIVKTNKSTGTSCFKIIDVDDKAILGEKLTYDKTNAFLPSGQRAAVDVSDLSEILVDGSFWNINDQVTLNFLNSRTKQ